MINQNQKKDVLNRLNKIEGQIRGVNRMITEDRYCMDILAQTRAVVSAIRKVEDLIMEQHLHTCVAASMRSANAEDKTEKIDEVMDILSKFRRVG